MIYLLISCAAADVVYGAMRKLAVQRQQGSEGSAPEPSGTLQTLHLNVDGMVEDDAEGATGIAIVLL